MEKSQASTRSEWKAFVYKGANEAERLPEWTKNSQMYSTFCKAAFCYWALVLVYRYPFRSKQPSDLFYILWRTCGCMIHSLRAAALQVTRSKKSHHPVKESNWLCSASIVAVHFLLKYLILPSNNMLTSPSCWSSLAGSWLTICCCSMPLGVAVCRSEQMLRDRPSPHNGSLNKCPYKTVLLSFC